VAIDFLIVYERFLHLMKRKRNAFYAWLFFGLVTASVLLAYGVQLSRPAVDSDGLARVLEAVWGLIPIIFAFVGALIISRQPRNVIGLLLMLSSLPFAIPAESYLAWFTEAPATPSLLLLLALWFNNWSWVLLVFPILFILVLFPSGQPPSPRWRLLIYVGIGMMLTMLFLSTFARELQPVNGGWGVHNPIGFIHLGGWVDAYLLPVWFVLLPFLTIGCAAAMFVRFRRARGVEREQIKWLFFASALFVAVYVPSFMSESYSAANNIWDGLFVVGILTIPAAIAIAILRHRLYDIDVIIRRTLQYALITGLLALVYFGSIVLLQSLFDSVTGEQSPAVIVLSTLLIAALFTPLRHRVQAVIDRRFFRQKYDAQQVLAAFALTARDETDLDSLNGELQRVIDQTLQPEGVGIWLRSERNP
jgi:hypothetical protein